MHMKQDTVKNNFIIYGMIILILFIDQITKHSVLTYFQHHPLKPIYVLPFFNITLVFNHGVTFGFLQTLNYTWALIALAFAVVIILLICLKKSPHFSEKLAYAAIIGGAIGNVYDRITKGAVVDFLDFHLCGYHWYTFNIADSAIVISVLFLLLREFLSMNNRG